VSKVQRRFDQNAFDGGNGMLGDFTFIAAQQLLVSPVPQ